MSRLLARNTGPAILIRGAPSTARVVPIFDMLNMQIGKGEVSHSTLSIMVGYHSYFRCPKYFHVPVYLLPQEQDQIIGTYL